MVGAFCKSPEMPVFLVRHVPSLKRFVKVGLRLSERPERDLKIPAKLFVRSAEALGDVRCDGARRTSQLFAEFDMARNVRTIGNVDHLVPKLR